MTATKLMDMAVQECPNAVHAIGALLLAAGSGSAFGELKLQDAVELLQHYYIQAAADAASAILAEAEGMPPRPPNGPTDGKLN